MGRLYPIYLAHEALFLATGIIILVAVLKARSLMHTTPTLDTIGPIILLHKIPHTAAIANAILIFVTFVLALPALLMRSNTKILQLHAWMVVVCAVFTLALGIDVWVATLRTRSMLSALWDSKSTEEQGMLQDRFDCCGFWNSTAPGFVTNSACPSVFAAAQTQGCVSPFTTYTNWYLQIIFTTLFGMVGIDSFVVIVTSMMVSWRKEQARYRHIDEKNAAAA